MSLNDKRPGWRKGFPLLTREAPDARLDRLRLQGDLHRNARRWSKAVGRYQAYLEGRPNDAAIWVQLGHAFKEEGFLDEGLAAYQRAVDLIPDDADAKTHLDDLKARLARQGTEWAMKVVATSMVVRLRPRPSSVQDRPAQSAEMKDIELLTKRLLAYA